MCTTPEQVRAIVQDELEGFMLKVDGAINARLLHTEPSPQTKQELQALKCVLEKHDKEERENWEKLDKILSYQEHNKQALDTLQDFLAGGRMLALFAKAVTTIGIIVGGFVAFKVWIIGK
jgi:hypothetical protein